MSIYEELLALSNPTPKSAAYDPDIDNDLSCGLTNVAVKRPLASSDLEKHVPSKLRKAAEILSDKKYSGKVLNSGKKYFSNVDDDDNDDAADYSGDAELDENISKHYIFEGDSGEDDSVLSLDQSSEASFDNDEEENESNLKGLNSEEENGSIVDDPNQISESKVNSVVDAGNDVAKGKLIQQCLKQWDSLMEYRIKLQPLVVLANSFPMRDVYNQLSTKAGTSKDINGLHKQLQALKFKLAQLHKHKLSSCVAPKKTNEEILSESEDDNKADDESLETKDGKLDINGDFEQFLVAEHTQLKQARNDMLLKCFDRLKFATSREKSFSNFDIPVLKQIDNILANRQQLIYRTTVKRLNFNILGLPNTEYSHVDEKGFYSNSEIFDDTDFYNVLLRELIDRKTNNLVDPLQMSQKYIEVDRLRTKIKRNVDTRASKGRKIRYDVHQKLVSFMAPTEHSTWSDDQKDDLFRCLFGGISERMKGS